MIFVLRFHLGKMTLIISVNGNIACGKSTLLRALEKRGYAVVMEGLDRDEWGNVLSMYYKNPKRYGYLFQTLVAAEMKETYAALRAGKYEKFTEKKDPKVIFTERSHVDCLAFAKLVWRQSNMSNVEYQTFKRIYNMRVRKRAASILPAGSRQNHDGSDERQSIRRKRAQTNQDQRAGENDTQHSRRGRENNRQSRSPFNRLTLYNKCRIHLISSKKEPFSGAIRSNET
jgi:predicted ATPase